MTAADWLLRIRNTRLSAIVAVLACVATYVLLWAVIA